MLDYVSLRILDDNLPLLYARTFSYRTTPARKDENVSCMKVLCEFGSVVCAIAGSFCEICTVRPAL